MARPRLNTLNFVYTAIGLGIADDGTKDSLMDVRRSSRKAGRAIKDAVQQVGKAVQRGANDVGEALDEASSFEADATGPDQR